MGDFSKFVDFVVPSEREIDNALYAGYRHQFFPLEKAVIDRVNDSLSIPVELLEFYSQIGYGFMYAHAERPNRLMDPYSFNKINLREDYYMHDPDLDLYTDMYEGKKLLFFEVVEGVYLAIDRIPIAGKNPVYYLRKRVADSLASFMDSFDGNPNLLAEIRDGSAQ